MLLDPYGRQISYLRISVTDKCNYRCIYCMPEEGIPLKRHDEILRYEDIARIVSAGAELGISKVRITGGEPLVKRNIEFLIREIANTKGIEETCMTTNGSLLTLDKARALERAGLDRVNISLDTLDPDRFAEITRGGDLNQVFRGIDAAMEAGLSPVKINMLVFENTSERDIREMQSFCRGKGASLQTIRRFSLYDRQKTEEGETDRPPACSVCNRLRLTADGFLKPCLFSDKELRVDLDHIKQSILAAVKQKPGNGKACRNRAMSQIGG